MITIIGILATITITAARGVQERGRIARAKSELAVLAAALEQYKLQYGDYPWAKESGDYYDTAHKNEKLLFQALTGQKGPRDASISGRSFIEVSKFTLWDLDEKDRENNWFVDPWGHAYSYFYRMDDDQSTDEDESAAWKLPSFVLYSHGPDTLCDYPNPTPEGQVSHSGDNADNIYVGLE